MVYGPCGGVRPDGGCEMADMPCVFPEPVLPSTSLPGRPLARVPLVLTDFSTPPFDRVAVARTATVLAGASDAVLVGDHQDRPDFPPTLFASLLLDAGCRPWVTLACRDRNRVVLEQELRGLQQVGVDAVLCVTGDGRAPDIRPEVTQVFDLDGPRLATLATETGISAAVPEAPLAEPRAFRPHRLVGKQHSGADVAAFVAAARGAGLTIPVIAAVAVYTDERSATVLQSLPGLELDAATVQAVLAAPDSREAGIAAAVAEARALLAIDGVVGVNVSGLASAAGWEQGAQVKAEVGHRIREGERR
jgi:5,10-methylenetetrahydrofolate reductase